MFKLALLCVALAGFSTQVPAQQSDSSAAGPQDLQTGADETGLDGGEKPLRVSFGEIVPVSAGEYPVTQT